MSLKSDFPSDFVWGTATSSYQIEGAVEAGGRGPSIWDQFCKLEGKVANGDSGAEACDHFHKFKEDIALMADMGVKAYRFSIAWPRLFSDGTADTFQQEGVDFYNAVIDECLHHGIEPWVTLYHWDLPLALDEKFGGWLSQEILPHFVHYSKTCFEQFGDRVRHWITINEAWVVAMLGYGNGIFAPGHESADEPYVVAHHVLLAHAQAVDCYRRHYQGIQTGKIGITNNCDWREPKTASEVDKAAAQRSLEFFLAWFADPIYFGDYPESMKSVLAERLPSFTDDEKKMIKGSSDFFGLNHYTTTYTEDAGMASNASSAKGNGGLNQDENTILTVDPQWPLTDMDWAVVPWGCGKLLRWISARYDNPEIVITENGCAYPEVPDESGRTRDDRRIEYYRSYLEACKQAIDDGVNLTGYFAWSFMDNFEWASGYEKRFGLHFVDYETGQRLPKDSALWFKRQLA